MLGETAVSPQASLLLQSPPKHAVSRSISRSRDHNSILPFSQLAIFSHQRGASVIRIPLLLQPPFSRARWSCLFACCFRSGQHNGTDSRPLTVASVKYIHPSMMRPTATTLSFPAGKASRSAPEPLRCSKKCADHHNIWKLIVWRDRSLRKKSSRACKREHWTDVNVGE
jgi:hypothetical protein